MNYQDFVMIGVIVFLAGINVYEKFRYNQRETDFLNRLMSRDFSQYVQGTTSLSRMSAPVTIEDVADHLATSLAESEEETSGTQEPERVRVGA